jgi:hypothetical protein
MRNGRRSKSAKQAKFSKNLSKRTIEQNWSIAMKHISQLASKPQLISVVIDDEATVTEFGEPLEFHTWDRQPLDLFLKLANRDQQDAATMLDLVRTLILDDKGKEVITKDQTLPTHVLMKIITKVVELLGKS